MKKLFIVIATVLLVAMTGCDKTKKEIPVASVTVQPSTVNIIEGETQQLTASVLPEDATDKSVICKSSDPAVATVSENGLVTAVAAGTATVTATSGDKQGTCNVIVKKRVIPVSDVILSESEIKLWLNEACQLTATVKPDNATYKTVAWSSSDNNIAEALSNGTVYARGEGVATITATAGEKSATCKVTVRVFGLSFNNFHTGMTVGEAKEFSAIVTPADAEYVVKWSVSNPSVASVTATDGLGHKATVKALAAGETDITIRAGGQEVTDHLTVKEAYIPVTSVSVSPASVSLIKGGTKTLTATVKPDNATDKSVGWSSSNVSVATVSSNGVVTAVGVGSAAITAKAGGKSASCNVTVTSGISGISITSKSNNDDWMKNKELHITQGEYYYLQATVNGSDGADKSVVWSSESSSYASVTSDGKVYGATPMIQGGVVKPVRIVAKSKADPSVSDYLNVYVYSKPTDIILTNTADAEFVPGRTRRLTFSVSPSTARQSLEMTNGNSSKYSPNWGLYRVTDRSYDFTAPTYNSSMDEWHLFGASYRFVATTIGSSSVRLTKSFMLELNQWLATDVKPMDYVYYNSTTDKFRISDGGLRAMVKTESICRKVSVSPSPRSGEKCIAVVTYIGKFMDHSYTSGVLPDFVDGSNVHGYAIALHDAPLKGEKYFMWSEDKDDVDNSDNWLSTRYFTYVPQNTPGVEWRTAFSLTFYTGMYNHKRGDSHDIKLLKALLGYANLYPSGTFNPNAEEVERYDGYNTHWVLPTYGMIIMSGYGSESYFNFLEPSWRDPLYENIRKAGGEDFAGSWSINTLDKSTVYLVGGTTTDKNSKYRLRPWLIF